MPRKPVTIAPKVEYLSVLDEHGQADQTLDPQLDDDSLLRLYRTMLLTRRVDERAINLQRQGRMGTYGPTRGQEAAHIGPAFALERDDWCVQSFRETGACLLRGWPIQNVFLFWGGYEEANVVPQGINDTPIAVPVATQLLHAAGVAWAMKLKKHPKVVLGFVGDGGTSEGDFHEALNFAAVFDLPVVFVIQNNQWAISHPRRKQTRSETLAQKALAYGFDGVQVDGNDILATYVAGREAVDKARSGGGPTLIEAVTYRLGVHTTADDPTKYRSAEEVDRWVKRDPLTRFTKYLTDKGVLNDQTIAEIDADVLEEVKRGVEAYESIGQVDPLDVFAFTYAEMPP
ncbi:MAG TPA: pyruvate dehydrogenase (acetyl-transferring) E1 component subunit alpha, partial [Phycisphaerae bacterium]|nr:pyruvate dehydrogenase (acetyl-transferring) E1 component subunit alpha [Phycisphaerae bacterium]